MNEIPVTEPNLPPIEEYFELLREVWSRKWLTNQGPLVRQLEEGLREHHGLGRSVHCVANAGLGLQIVLKALGVKGEVVTTPFSYVATTSCPIWEGCRVRFSDVEPELLTIDPDAVEAAIGPHTEAILATHVYGNPCDVEALRVIGDKYGIAIIYDAAHAFGVKYKGKSLLEWGDASVVSTHATKVFNTVEGGFVVSSDPAVSEKIEWLRRFGHKGKDDFHGAGINAKMSEFHAAMGLCNLRHIEEVLARRRGVVNTYDSAFFGSRTVVGSGNERECEARSSSEVISFAFRLRPETDWNCAYYPVKFSNVGTLLQVMNALEAQEVYPRRYFYPSLNRVQSLGGFPVMPVSEEVAERILCLPLSAEISNNDQKRIIMTVLEELQKSSAKQESY